MTLEDVIRRIGELDEEAIIYAAGGADAELSSRAVVIEDSGDDVPLEAEGLDYFMGVYTAREVVEDWTAHTGTGVSVEEAGRVLKHYAKHDAYPQE
jgi:hypothetical protein